MIRVRLACALALCLPLLATPAIAQQKVQSDLDALVARHAAANGIPESLVRRIIKRESGGRAHVVSKGNYGIMQIKLATARGMGYTGGAAGLLDADTNMTYAVKYLANAYKVAGGNESRAVALYAGGYYYAAKSKSMLDQLDGPATTSLAMAESALGVTGTGSATVAAGPGDPRYGTNPSR